MSSCQDALFDRPVGSSKKNDRGSSIDQELERSKRYIDNEMTLNEYQEATSYTAKYPNHGTGKADALAYVGLGLGETGEIQNQIKKILRDDDGMLTEQRKADILAEAGDVLWYLARLADELETPLSEIARNNIIKLEDRKARGVIGGSGDHR